MILKYLFYDLAIHYLKLILKSPQIGISPEEVFLNNYYRGLDDDDWNREYAKTQDDIKDLEERIAKWKEEGGQDELVETYEYLIGQYQEKLNDMDEAKENKFNQLIREPSYDILDNVGYMALFEFKKKQDRRKERNKLNEYEERSQQFNISFDEI